MFVHKFSVTVCLLELRPFCAKLCRGEIRDTVCMQNTVPVSAEEHGTARHACERCVHFPGVLDAFRIVAKRDYYFHYVRPSDYLSVRTGDLCSRWADFREIFDWNFLLKFVDII